jgi:hypothetical protein
LESLRFVDSTLTEHPDRRPNRPVLAALLSHWLSMLGVFLLVTALITWAFVLPLHGSSNPYIGIVTFVVIPILFVAGLVAIPAGLYLGRRQVRATLEAVEDRRVVVRRFLIFLGVATLINVIVGTQITYRAVEQMESVQFCGGACHVMTPHARSHQVSPHARVACVSCHVGEGARGVIEAKAAGTRQLVEVALNSYPRPVPSALGSGRLVPSNETCEHCHWPGKFSATRLKVLSKFGEDETNTETQTVLMMMVGGSRTGGIHGRHFGPGIEIRFAAADAQRETIPWVEYENANTGESRVYTVDGAGADVGSLPKIAMQCVDCHNRPAHTSLLPDRALDQEFAGGLLPTTLPYLKKKSKELLEATYGSSEEAATSIPNAIVGYYKQSHPEVYAARTADVEAAGRRVAEIYSRNVFPEFKVTWGTYRNNLGHESSPGCFRCHDEQHKSPEGKTITQDCAACHETIAIDETSPDVLKTLGLIQRMGAIRKQ